METVLGMLLAAAPLAALASVLGLTNRRERRRRAAAARQIALTDAIHARLGAVVAPVVRLHGRRWQVAIAAPLERPSLVAGVLEIVKESFTDPGSLPYEVVVRPQPAPERRATAPRRAPTTRESLSWT